MILDEEIVNQHNQLVNRVCNLMKTGCHIAQQLYHYYISNIKLLQSSVVCDIQCKAIEEQQLIVRSYQLRYMSISILQ